jgi:hypothetical protein
MILLALILPCVSALALRPDILSDMNKCPYCDYVTPEDENGDPHVRGWQEVAHMNVNHPDIIKERLEEMGPLDVDVRFGTPD